MKRALVFLVGFAVLAGGATVATAGTLDNMLVGLHLQPKVTKNFCTSGQAGTGEFACDTTPGSSSSTLNVTGTVTTAYEMYIVLLDVPAAVGVQGIELGIDYDDVGNSGLDIFGEVVCADQQFAGLGWPESGGAATYTWVGCQKTVDATDPDGDAVVITTSLYAYAWTADTACIVQKPSGIYGATDCAAASSDLLINFPLNSGCAGFDQPGTDPCIETGVPVEESTWGSIKSQFSRP